MKLSSLTSMAPALYLSGKSIYLKSAPGRGKTTTVKDCVPLIARKLNKKMGFVLINGPLLTPADAVGYLVPTKADDGRIESKYTDPFWWRTSEGKRLEEYDGGIVFVDEADKMDVDVKKVIGEMALTGRCGPHQLPPGWSVWMAGNRSGDRSGSTKELDHLINRRIELDVTDDIEGWVDWAMRHNVPPTLVAFAKSNPQIVFPNELPKEQGPFCTPRSLVAVGELLASISGDVHKLPLDDAALELTAGGIGQAAAAQLWATIKLEAELPDLARVVAEPDKAKLPKAPDAQMLAVFKLASLTDDKNLAPIITYVERLPADFAATYAKSIGQRNPRLFVQKPMVDWCKRNSSLVSLVAAFSNN